jgi:hypothetical protein
MQALQEELEKREREKRELEEREREKRELGERKPEKPETLTNFHHTKNRVRCFAHIINICPSHVVAAMCSSSGDFSDPTDDICDYDYDSDYDDEPSKDDSDAESVDSDDNENDSPLDSHPWAKGLRRNPLKRARRLIRFLRASDQRKNLLRTVIEEGNERSWFTMKDKQGKRVVIDVPQLQLLRDVKTRWDSVYLMLDRLRSLRPVSYITRDDWTRLNALFRP